MLLALIPIFGMQLMIVDQKRHGRRHGLIMLRQLYLFMLSVCALLVVVLGVVSASAQSGPALPRVAAMLGLAAVSQVFGWWFEPPLKNPTAETAAGLYRTRMVLRLAFAEGAVLLGGIASIGGAWWALPVGLLLSAPGFVRAEPTSENVRRYQERLQSEGFGGSLLAAMRGDVASSPIIDEP